MIVESWNPYRSDDLVATAPAASRDDVTRAAQAARTAQAEWMSIGPTARGAALRRIGDRLEQEAGALAGLMVREVAKPVAEAKGEMARAIGIVHYAAQQVLDPYGETYPNDAEGYLLTQRRPRGLAGLITPWNFPIAIPLWKAAPALATGNGVLLKPSPEALGCATELVRILAAELPEGLVALLPGGAETGSAVVSAADAVSFTGSCAVGRTVISAAAGRGVPVQAEMGGMNPAIVLADADIERAAADLAYAVTGYGGQKCTATRRVLCERAVYDDVVAALRERLAGAVAGDPADPATVVPPLINAAATERARAVVDEAVAAGATPVYRGEGGVALLTGVPARAVLAREELFGPVVQVAAVDSLDEAVATANDTEYGLTAGVYGRAVDACLRVAERLDAGMIKINAPTTGVGLHTPFGGSKASSYGPREQGKTARDLYTQIHTITLGTP
ncbi:aldehyde dehydrogenase [Sinosporangium siamense]|uniref:Aldehyde dehydrogenase n=1 Tax=Sinosporangium siamense TaxID=1367973 RepID=A0A919V967_9ACTN|nr:aldehyde dehydrogenase [Sinosporangium siamense]